MLPTSKLKEETYNMITYTLSMLSIIILIASFFGMCYLGETEHTLLLACIGLGLLIFLNIFKYIEKSKMNWNELVICIISLCKCIFHLGKLM